jgi:iron(II)-dependent oxidoreductase
VAFLVAGACHAAKPATVAVEAAPAVRADAALSHVVDVGTATSSAPAPDAGAGALPCPEGMKFIPGGQAPHAWHDTPTPSFCIDELETTVAQYQECVRAGRCHNIARDSGCGYLVTSKKRLQNPIDCLSFEDARSYCRFRQKRLPWPNEWGRAAGGDKGTKHPWGNDLKAGAGGVCWGRTDAQGPCDVGTSQADVSVFGVRDMAGNVTEWTSDPQNERYPPRRWEGRFEAILGYSWDLEINDVLIRLAGSVTAREVPQIKGASAGVRCASPPRESRR